MFGGKNINILTNNTKKITMNVTNKLTELSIKQAKPKEKQYKLTDGGHVFKDLPEWLKILAIKIPF